jgi:hypothetical protein
VYENGNRSSNFMPPSGQYGGVSRESFAENYGHGPPPPRHASRMQPDQTMNRYATPGTPSHPATPGASLTIYPGASSGSEQWTGPASEESSLERANGVARPVPPQHGAYPDAVTPVGQQQYMEEDWSQQAPPRGRQPGPANGYANGGGYPPTNGYGQNYAAPGGGYYPPPNNQQAPPPQQMNGGGGMPRPPPKDEMPQRRPIISLNNPNPETAAAVPQRKSWLKRFSKSGK